MNGSWMTGLALAGLVGWGAAAQEAKRVEPVQETWNLADLFATPQAFDEARQTLARRLPELDAHQGQLGTSAKSLADALDLYFGLRKDLLRVRAWAERSADGDTRVPEALARRQELVQLASQFEARAAWLAPELLALPAGAVTRFVAAEKRLEPYAFVLSEIERRRPHTLSPGEEKLLAQAGVLADAPSSLRGILANADLPYPEVTLSTGEKVRLDAAAYTKYRALPARADRELVFREFWTLHQSFERTFGVALDAQLQRDLFYARARKQPTALSAALFESGVPEQVYRTLVSEANRALPTLHRAFKLRARLLGIPDLAYHDLYPPLTKGAGPTYPIDKGKTLVLEALAPLGPEYVAGVRQGFDQRWMDTYPRPGKRSGAYSDGSAYDVHPYVLMNYNDDYEGLTTLAHEWGHAMHSHLANGAQPFPRADYATFAAEVASTFNEALLLDDLLKHARSDDERLFLLGSYLEGLRLTFFRQTMFAEFELATHEAAERGESLSGARFTKIYGDLLRRYHGSDQGVVRIEPREHLEWAYIPHFYYNFYVFQYATSLAASSQLAQEVLAGKPGAKERYLGLLKAGGSRLPHELLKEAGVDLATPAPYRALEARMNWAMDEIEKVLARRK